MVFRIKTRKRRKQIVYSQNKNKKYSYSLFYYLIFQIKNQFLVYFAFYFKLSNQQITYAIPNIMQLSFEISYTYFLFIWDSSTFLLFCFF